MLRGINILYLILFLFTSCVKEVQIDIDPIPSSLVVVSNFSNGDFRSVRFSDTSVLGIDSSMLVTVSRTTSALASGDTLVPVSNAIVELWSRELGEAEDADEFRKKLEYYEPTISEKEMGIEPHYTSQGFVPQPGNIYTIKVEAPNFSPVTSSCSIPYALAISDAAISIEESLTANGFNSVDFDFDFSIRDYAGVENYYHLNLYREKKLIRVSINGDTIFAPVLEGPLEFNLRDNDQEVLPYIDSKGVLINDRNFDGQVRNFSFEGNFPYNRKSERLGVFYVELRNASEEYYLYHSSLSRQNRVQSGFDAINGPVVLFNNIDDGYGIFAGYTPVYTIVDLSN